MKRTNLCIALISALVTTGPASAVTVAPEGRGQALIYPFYTVESGQTTLLSITNHTDRAKVLTVNVREAQNGRQVMSFNLYLGKNDVWSAGIFGLNADGPANLTSADRSCTVPGIAASVALNLPTLPNGQRFVSFRNFGYTGPMADGGAPQLARTRIGFVEIIETATLVPDSPSDLAANAAQGAGCDSLEQAWSPAGYWTQNPATDLAPPTGGLSGSLQVIDVADGALAAAPATALSQFNNSTLHPRPGASDLAGDGAPGTLGAARSSDSAAQSLVVTSNGTAKTSNWPLSQAYKAVSAALAKASAGQEFLVNASLGGASDWVLTFPTRRFHTDPARTPTAVAPFTTRFGGSSVAPVAACDPVPIVLRDRERAVQAAQSLNLCGSVQVLGFAGVAGPSAVVGALNALQVQTSTFGEGTAELDFRGYTSSAAEGGETWTGLPMIGVWLYRYSNSNARPGQLGLYSGAAPLTGTTACTGSGC